MGINKSDINTNFLIKINGKNYVGPSISKLVGVNGLVELIGEKLAYKYCQKAIDSPEDVPTFKLRRGLKLRFYSQ